MRSGKWRTGEWVGRRTCGNANESIWFPFDDRTRALPRWRYELRKALKILRWFTLVASSEEMEHSHSELVSCDS